MPKAKNPAKYSDQHSSKPPVADVVCGARNASSSSAAAATIRQRRPSSATTANAMYMSTSKGIIQSDWFMTAERPAKNDQSKPANQRLLR